jgi:hypothetical protein
LTRGERAAANDSGNAVLYLDPANDNSKPEQSPAAEDDTAAA